MRGFAFGDSTDPVGEIEEGLEPRSTCTDGLEPLLGVSSGIRELLDGNVDNFWFYLGHREINRLW